MKRSLTQIMQAIYTTYDPAMNKDFGIDEFISRVHDRTGAIPNKKIIRFWNIAQEQIDVEPTFYDPEYRDYRNLAKHLSANEPQQQLIIKLAKDFYGSQTEDIADAVNFLAGIRKFLGYIMEQLVHVEREEYEWAMKDWKEYVEPQYPHDYLTHDFGEPQDGVNFEELDEVKKEALTPEKLEANNIPEAGRRITREQAQLLIDYFNALDAGVEHEITDFVNFTPLSWANTMVDKDYVIENLQHAIVALHPHKYFNPAR